MQSDPSECIDLTVKHPEERDPPSARSGIEHQFAHPGPRTKPHITMSGDCSNMPLAVAADPVDDA
jgi:hypothetical protein